MEVLVIVVLVVFSAFFSGMTIGFFSLNLDDLKRKAALGNKKAMKVYAIRRDGNRLLTTMLIGNVAVNAALSIFLGSLASGLTAGLTATALIVIFGEITPQAVAARHALPIASKIAWLVKIFMFILAPIAWPIARVLDMALGVEIARTYTKPEFIKMIEDHEDSANSDIDADEERIVKGALSFSEKNVYDILTPRTSMFCLQVDEILNDAMMLKISLSGHSRIPVFGKDRDDIVGILYVKDLIKNEWEGKAISELARQQVNFVDDAVNLDDLLNMFKKTKSHLFIVIDDYGTVEGLVTVEDVIEEIIGEEIVDEFDQHVDLQKVAIAKMKTRKINRVG